MSISRITLVVHDVTDKSQSCIDNVNQIFITGGKLAFDYVTSALIACITEDFLKITTLMRVVNKSNQRIIIKSRCMQSAVNSQLIKHYSFVIKLKSTVQKMIYRCSNKHTINIKRGLKIKVVECKSFDDKYINHQTSNRVPVLVLT